MGFRDEREALIAERNNLRQENDEQQQKLDALRDVAERNAQLEAEVARLRGTAPKRKAAPITVDPPRTQPQSARSLVFGILFAAALIVGFATYVVLRNEM